VTVGERLFCAFLNSQSVSSRNLLRHGGSSKRAARDPSDSEQKP
jgi:hypothetical protein